VALYASHLIKGGNSDGALELYVKYGVPAVKQVFYLFFFFTFENTVEGELIGYK
jgi:hypothetical protein